MDVIGEGETIEMDATGIELEKWKFTYKRHLDRVYLLVGNMVKVVFFSNRAVYNCFKSGT